MLQSFLTTALWASAAFALPRITNINTPSSINKRIVDLNSKVVEMTLAYQTGAGSFTNENYNDNNGRTGPDGEYIPVMCYCLLY